MSALTVPLKSPTLSFLILFVDKDFILKAIEIQSLSFLASLTELSKKDKVSH